VAILQVSVELPIVAMSSVYLADLYKEGCKIRQYDSPIENGNGSYLWSTLPEFPSVVPPSLEADQFSDTRARVSAFWPLTCNASGIPVAPTTW
jgi:hypothetical protein